MINRWASSDRKDGFVESHRFLLVYAHIIAIVHGIGFLVQGTTRLSGPIKYALHQTEAWHGGLPAISIFGMAILAGISVTLLSIFSLWLAFSKLKASYCFLWILIFACGGGFVYAWITLFTAVSLFVLKPKTQIKHTALGKALILVLLFWLFGSWALGWALPHVMSRLSLPIFIIFDITTPLMIIIFHRQPLKTGKTQID